MCMFYNCPECGWQIFDAEMFCDHCGKEIDWNRVDTQKGIDKNGLSEG